MLDIHIITNLCVPHSAEIEHLRGLVVKEHIAKIVISEVLIANHRIVQTSMAQSLK